MSNQLATIIIIGACLLAAAVVTAFAGYEGQRHGYNSPRGVGAIAAAIAVIALLLWAVWARFDAPAETEAKGTAGNAGPVTLGVASRGDAPVYVVE